MRITLLAAAATLVAISLTAAAQDDPAQDAPPAQNDPVVARVDEHEITRSDVEREVAGLPEQYAQMPFATLFDALRDRAIDSALLSAEADRLDLAADPEVQAALADAERLILRNRLIETTLADVVTEEAVQAAYEARQAEPGFANEEVKARHILVESRDDAVAVIEELAAGADFATLAEERSTGPSGPQGGDLGYFQREQMVGPFADAAFGMEPGTFSSEPVETQFGWHVILVEDRRSVMPTLEETRAEIESALGRDAMTTLLTSLRDDAEIERFGLDGGALPAPEAPAE